MLTQCNRSRQTLCADCGADCSHAGDKGADCPKYKCDNERPHDCANCAYIDQYIRIMRGELRKEA